MPAGIETSHIGANEKPGFLIGVTGHRDLVPDEEPQTRRQVRKILAALVDRTPDKPVRLITGLAEGADTLVAEVALELGIDVEAVLPMPEEFYRDDFDGDALKSFRKLQGNTRVKVHTIPLASGVGVREITDSRVRAVQYALLMDHIQRRVDILLGLWDGTQNGLIGGTRDVLLGFLAGSGRDQFPVEIPVKQRPDTGSVSGIVIWVPVSRCRNPKPTKSNLPVFLVSDASGAYYWQETIFPQGRNMRWPKLGT